MTSGRTPSKTGVATGVFGAPFSAPLGTYFFHSASRSGSRLMSQPECAIQPRCSSSTWPRFIREGTPSGLSMMSTGVPSARNGMSSSGRMREMQPLLPWRPDSLSPTVILRCCAMYTRIIWLTPLGSSSPSSSASSRVISLTAMTVPVSPWGTRSDVSRTSRDFSPKMARSRRSSGVSSVSPFGVTLPTRMSPASTSAPMRMMPRSSRLATASSPTFGRSRVISSAPSLVSRASISYSSMWMELRVSSCTRRCEMITASS